MSTFRIDVTRTDHLAEFERIFTETATLNLSEGLNLLKSAAEQFSPVYQGVFKSSYSIFYRLEGNARVVGELINSSPHAGVIEGVDSQGNDTEYGRRPGAKFPPVNVLALWVQRVLGVQGPQLARVTFLVGRAISRRGIKPTRPTAKAWELKQAEIIRLFEVDLPAQVEARI